MTTELPGDITLAEFPEPEPVVCACDGCTVQSIRSDLDNVLTIVKDIQEQVGPTLDALTQSPLLKMFFNGKGK